MSASPFEVCPRCETPVVGLDSHMARAHGVTTGRRRQRCAYCGDGFERDHSNQRFCSRACANRARQRGGET